MQALACLLLFSFGVKASADDFDNLRLKWRDVLTLGTNSNPADPNYSAWIASITNVAQSHWTSMRTSPTRTFLWSDLNGLSTNSADITGSYVRLKAMAMAYAVRGSTLESNASLRAAIIDGLDWMHSRIYNTNDTNNVLYDNWFDWQIGTPLNLNDTTVLLYNDLSSAQISSYMGAVDYFTPAPDLTGANLVWKAHVVALRGAIVKSNSKLTLARTALSDVFPYVAVGDGFHTDGSFVFHEVFPYNGHYGAELISTLAPMMSWLKSSRWEVADPLQANLYRWIYDSFEPFIYRGAMMQMVSGRVYTRVGDDHRDGHDVIASILRISEFAPAADAAAYNSMVKHWIATDTFRDFIATQPPPFNIRAKQIRDDASITPRGEPIGHYQFPDMDRVVHFRPGWAFGLAMSSKRIGNYESTRGENLRGWYTGDGMTYLYNSDLAHYADSFWPTVDPYRLPGTTVDTQTRTNASGEDYLSPNYWAGGAFLPGEQFGVASMHLNAWNSPLSARKSWFMFDNEVVCLGMGITCPTNRTVETTVENRRLAGYGNNQFTVNGVAWPNSVGWAEAIPNASWAHLVGSVPDADIGYYFPNPAGQVLNAVREARSGSLRDINSAYGSSTVATRNYLTLWFDHGMSPSNATYAYVLLPAANAAQTATYATTPDIVVLENSTRMQGVRENTLGITAVNFWRDGTNRLGGITADQKCSVICRNDGTYMELGISDPAQTNTGILTLEITNVAATVQSLSLDPRITVLQVSPVLRIACDLNDTAGRSLHARFFVGQVNTINTLPEADAYVENGASININFGARQTLAVKASPVSTGREAYLRFPVPSNPGTVFDANLRLLAVTVNDPVLYHALAFVPDNAWGENTITWNNRPGSEGEFMRWLLPAEGSPVNLSLTELVQRAADTNSALSIRLYSTATPPPTNGFAAYGSKEGGAANRPQLTVTYGRAPPTVSITSPQNGAIFNGDSAVTLSAVAEDLDGAITSVQFLGLSAPITTPPYSIVLQDLASGEYNVTAIATDSAGLTSTSRVSFAVYDTEPTGRGTGLIGEYYDRDNLTALEVTRTDPAINFDWQFGNPAPGVLADTFSVRWTGKIQARRAGLHTFHVASDEGVRLWINGQLLVDNWMRHPLTENSGTISLIPGQYYDIKLEYFDFSGLAIVQLYWTEPGGAKQIVPQSQLYPADGGLTGTYFANTNLTTSVFTRVDDTVNFDWDNSSPDPALLPGNFAVRWTGKVRANQGGAYTFHTLSDDGVRLWIGGQLIINNWTVHTATEDSATVNLAAGQLYDVMMDYFDGGGVATVALMWTPPGGMKHVIPRSNLTPHQNNNPPALATLSNGTVARGQSTSIPVTATDPDPGQVLTYSIDSGAPAGLTINPSSGVITWNTSPTQTIGNYNVVVRVSDNGVPAMTDAGQITITVTDTMSSPVTLIAAGQRWRFLDNGSNPGATWRDISFNDSAWQSGPAPLGYGTSGEATLLSYGGNAADKHITTYFRRPLLVPDASKVQSLTANLLRNDGAIVYINGAEAWRDNMPTGAVTSATLASALVTGVPAWITRTISPALLADGTNIVAVEIHQNSAAGPDILFDLELTGMAALPSEVPLQIINTINGLTLRWPVEAGLLQLYTTTSLASPITWTPVEITPAIVDGHCVVILPTAAAHAQFYRLQSQ